MPKAVIPLTADKRRDPGIGFIVNHSLSLDYHLPPGVAIVRFMPPTTAYGDGVLRVL
jgi:hypothetical protein